MVEAQKALCRGAQSRSKCRLSCKEVKSGVPHTVKRTDGRVCVAFAVCCVCIYRLYVYKYDIRTTNMMPPNTRDAKYGSIKYTIGTAVFLLVYGVKLVGKVDFLVNRRVLFVLRSLNRAQRIDPQ